MDFSMSRQCLSKPTAEGLEEAFKLFGVAGAPARAPCNRIRNNCAVRMCVALSRSMNVDVLGAYTGGMVHSGRNCMGAEKFRHISSSQELFNYLRGSLGFSFVRLNTDGPSPSGKGILFFRNCFHRARDAEGVNRGDHIDYWNGQAYTNAATGTGAPRGRLDLFERADRVYFCRL